MEPAHDVRSRAARHRHVLTAYFNPLYLSVLPDSKVDKTSISGALSFPLKSSARDWLIAVFAAGVALELLRIVLPILLEVIVVLVVTCMIWVMLFRIASELLLSTAQGDPYTPTIRQTEAPDRMAIRHIALWFLAALLVAAAIAAGGRYAGLVMTIALTLLLPVATLILTLRNSVLDAFNPIAAGRLIRILGLRDYSWLSALLLGLALTYLLLDTVIKALQLPAGIQNIVMLVYWAWSLLAWFFFAGGVLLKHQAELELAPEDEGEAVRPEPSYSKDPQTLWQEIQARGGTQAMHQTLAHALDRDGDAETRMQHGRMHISALLLAFDEPDQALQRADQLLQADADFALDQPDDMFSLILASIERQHHWLSAKLCRSYLNRFSYSVRGNEVRLLACESLKNEKGQYRPWAQNWFGELMTEPLTPQQRQRLNDIAPFYLNGA